MSYYICTLDSLQPLLSTTRTHALFCIWIHGRYLQSVGQHLVTRDSVHQALKFVERQGETNNGKRADPVSSISLRKVTGKEWNQDKITDERDDAQDERVKQK